MPFGDPQDAFATRATKPARNKQDVNRPGPHGGTWAQADWTARHRPTTSRAVTAYLMRGVWLVEIAAPLTEVGDEVAETVRLALAESPRGVVLELDVAPNLLGPDGLDRLASSGRHPWAWPAAPVAVASTDPQVKARLLQHAYGRNLVHCSSMLRGWAQIMNTEPALTTHLELASNALAAKTARQFVARTCLDWHLGTRRSAAVAIASELTANAVQHANSTDLKVILALSGSRLRIAVRDHSVTEAPQDTPGMVDPLGHGLRLVHSLADLTGSLPTRAGGTLDWAILGPGSEPS